MSLYVGAITGTSVDGLDLAIVDIQTSKCRVRFSKTTPFSNTLRTDLMALAQQGENELERFGEAHAALGTFIGLSINEFLREHAIDKSDVRAIGTHGQTVRHRPAGEHSFSLQIGDPSRVVEITGIDTIADFRSRDIAAGGEGAPLVPILHRHLFQSRFVDRVILNIGGIANVTNLPHEKKEIIGFDTGPGNALIDAWIQRAYSKKLDAHGQIAASGHINENLLSELMLDEWLAQKPPKSTGKERYNENYVSRAISQLDQTIPHADVAATLTEFTALSISTAIRSWCCVRGEVLVCGGGRLNDHLMKRLSVHLPDHSIYATEKIGIDGDSVEAATFAYLAYRFVNRLPFDMADVTGAKGERVLGCLYPVSG